MRRERALQHEGAHGLTVLELLLAIVIFLTLGGTLLMTFLTAQKLRASAEAFLQIHQEARRGISAMAADLRQAGGVTVTGTQRLDFRLNLGYNRPGCPPGICWGAKDQNGVGQPGWSVRYRISGTQMLRELQDGAGALQPGARVLVNGVGAGASAFGWDATNQVVTITLETRLQDPALPSGSQSTGPLTRRVSLRN